MVVLPKYIHIFTQLYIPNTITVNNTDDYQIIFVSSGHFESIRYASERYYQSYEHVEKHLQKNYFRAIQDIHIALNLTISLNGLTIILPIVSDQ